MRRTRFRRFFRANSERGKSVIERADRTLQPAALVNEDYLRLAELYSGRGCSGEKKTSINITAG
jgi:hypothetical protein